LGIVVFSKRPRVQTIGFFIRREKPEIRVKEVKEKSNPGLVSKRGFEESLIQGVV
jgi:hypothetical protein